ncbi:hypothetical protein [Nitratireductor sp. GCM10026969]
MSIPTPGRCGIIGERTRMALHKALNGANPYEERVPVPVVPH